MSAWFRSILGVLFLTFLSQLNLTGQTELTYFHEFAPTKELAHQPANCILKDQKGILWIGTFSGLYKYDGLKLEHFIHKAEDSHSLLNNNVSGLAEDSHGQIWIITESGLSCFNPRDRLFYSWRDENFRQLYKDFQGNILAVSRRANEVIKIIPKESQDEELQKNVLIGSDEMAKANPQIKLLTLIEDHKGQLWMGSNKGLLSYQPERGVVLVKMTQPITALALSNDGQSFWMGMRGPSVSQFFYSENKVERKMVLSSQARVRTNDLLLDEKKNLWIASTNGLYKISGIDSAGTTQVQWYQADETRLGALPSNHLISIYQDNNLNLWFGTLQGIRQVRQNPFTFEHLKIEGSSYFPINQIITEVFIDKQDRMWIGTENDGLFCRENEGGRFVKIPLPGGHCEEIMLSNSGDLWVAIDEASWSISGEFSLDQAQVKNNWKLMKRGGNSIRCIIEAKPEVFWLGLWRNGIQTVDLRGDFRSLAPLMEEKNSHSEFHVEAFLKDSNGNIWVGTRGYGLYILDTNGKVLKFFDLGAKKGKIAYGVLTIFEDSKGEVWVGTRGGGLLHFTNGYKLYESYTTQHGLPFNTICSIIEDELNRIWVSTENGLAIYLPNEPVPFIPYGREDGLLNAHFDFNSAAKNSRGELFFGNKNGLYKIIPKPFNITKSTLKPLIGSIQVIEKEKGPEISQLNKLDLESRLGTGKLELDYKERSFDIHFTALNFGNPQKIRYAYRLVGYEEDWTYVLDGKNSARYIEVPPGDYQFQLKSSDSQGRWSDNILEIPVYIETPFWLSRGAYVVYFLCGTFLLISIGFLLLKWNFLRRRLKQASQERARQQTSLSYFSDISHEIRNRLTMILGPLEDVLRSEGDNFPVEVLQRVYRNAHRLKLLTDEIMNLRKGEIGTFILRVGRGDIKKFLLRIKQDMGEIARIRKVRLDFESEEEEVLAWFDQQLVEIIALNLLSNSLKYTPEGGQVSFSIGIRELNAGDFSDWNLEPGEYIHFEVRDTGKGISKEDLERIFEPYFQGESAKRESVEGTGLGLDLVARLVQLHHGAIVAESQPGKETLVSCWIPRNRDMYREEELQMVPLESVPDSHESTHKGTELNENKALILIAEDDQDLRQMLAQALEGEFLTCQAENGNIAYELAKEKKPDFILSDLVMTGGDGLEFLKKVRNDKYLRDTPFIILTARYSESQRLACIRNHANDFIEKPFRMEFLKWRIRNMLESRRRLEKKYSRMGMAAPKEVNAKSAEDKFIEQVVGLMETHIEASWLSVDFLASEMSMSRATFYRRMEEIMNDSPSNFIKQFRLKRATQLLQLRRFNISEISYQTGFKNPRYFSKCFQREFGVSPSIYLKQLAEEEKPNIQV